MGDPPSPISLMVSVDVKHHVYLPVGGLGGGLGGVCGGGKEKTEPAVSDRPCVSIASCIDPLLIARRTQSRVGTGPCTEPCRYRSMHRAV